MTQIINFEGEQHRFPDDFSQADIAKALRSLDTQKEEVRQRQEPGSVIRGIPILGAYEPQMGAAVSAAAQPFTGVGEKGSTWRERYEANRKKYMAESEQFAQQHPITEAVGQGIGGTLALGGFGAAAGPARLMGMARGLSLPQMVARGSLSQGAISAADTAARGGDIGDIDRSAAIGAGTGMLGPLAGAGVGRLAAWTTDRVGRIVRNIRRPEEAAAMDVTRAVAEGQAATRPEERGLRPHELTAAARLGLPVRTIDLAGASGRRLAQHAAALSPEADTTIRNVVEPRFQQQQQQMSDWLRGRFGHPDADAQARALNQVKRVENGPNYERAFADGDFDLSTMDHELQRLSGLGTVQAAMKKAVQTVRDEEIRSGYGAFHQTPQIRPGSGGAFTRGRGGMPGPTFPNLRFWDAVRQELSDAGWRAGRGTNEYRRLMGDAMRLNERLDALVPSYKTARETAAGFKGYENALEAGRGMVGKNIDPREMRRRLNDMGPVARQLFGEGYADAFIQRVQNNYNFLNRFTRSTAERERLATALGPQFARDLEVYMHIENAMNLTERATRGSNQAMRQLTELGMTALATGLGGAGAGEIIQWGRWGEGRHFWQNPATLVGAVLTYGLTRSGRRMNQAVQTQIANNVARMLVSNNGRDIQRGIQLIANNDALLDAVRTTTAWMADVGARGISQQATRPPKRDKPHITITPEPKYQGFME